MQERICMEKRKRVLIFCIILLLQCLVIAAWGTQKVRLNIDEMFTMEGVRQGGQSMRYWDMTEDFYGKEHSYQEFSDHMTVTTDGLFLYQGMSEVSDALLHRDIYYSLINLLSTVRPERIPWPVGVGLNLLFFVVSQILLYSIAKEILGEAGALATVTMYGFSTGAISTVLYVRCYMLLTLYVLLLIYLYLRFMAAEKGWQKVLYIVSTELLAFLCYRTHQFGVILFGAITALFVLYMIGSRKKNLIWLAAGYGLSVLLGIRVVLPRVQGFFGDGVAAVFYKSVRDMSGERFAANIIQMFCIVAQHLFVRVRIMLLFAAVMLLLYGRIMYIRRKNVERCEEKGDRNQFVMIAIFMICVAIYYGILIMGGAVAWKYLSPVYPLIVLAFMSMLFRIGRAMNPSFRVKAATAAAGILLTLVSYDANHVSELFAEEAGMREILETQYSGINGIMVHHDVQGDGENCLYEAAALWPEESNVLVLQHHMILEKGLFEYRDDDKILLWLTADFDREESIELFKACTDYTNIRPVLNTDHVWVYECSK